MVNAIVYGKTCNILQPSTLEIRAALMRLVSSNVEGSPFETAQKTEVHGFPICRDSESLVENDRW